MIRIHKLIVGRVSSSGGSDAGGDKYAVDGCAIVILVICFRWDRWFVDVQCGFAQSQVHQHFADWAFSDVIVSIQAHQYAVALLFPFLDLMFEIPHEQFAGAFKFLLSSEVS